MEHSTIATEAGYECNGCPWRTTSMGKWGAYEARVHEAKAPDTTEVEVIDQ